MKPSDAFLGVIDFFATLVPGSIAAFFVVQQVSVETVENWPAIKRGSAEGWAVFLVSAFLLGHVITAVGSASLDPLYGRTYVRWQRASAKWVRSELHGEASRWRVRWQRIQHVVRKSNPDDELLKVAKILKARQLGELARAAGVKAGDISNTFNWAGSVVRATNVAEAAEIEKLSAQSKLFRSLTVLLFLAILWALWADMPVRAAWAAIALMLSVWRFMRLRWDATERTYEYFLATEVAPKS